MAKQGLAPPFSQYDMVMVQWAFVGPPLLFGDQLGFNRMTVDEKALLAKTFFKVGQALGKIIFKTDHLKCNFQFLMDSLTGVEDEYNLCSGTLDEITSYGKEIQMQIIRPATDLNRSDMADTFLEALKMLHPYLDPEAFASFSREIMLGESAQIKSSWSRVNLLLLKFIFNWLLLKSAILGLLAKSFFNFMARVNNYITEFRVNSIIKQKQKMHMQ